MIKFNDRNYSSYIIPTGNSHLDDFTMGRWQHLWNSLEWGRLNSSDLFPSLNIKLFILLNTAAHLPSPLSALPDSLYSALLFLFSIPLETSNIPSNSLINCALCWWSLPPRYKLCSQCISTSWWSKHSTNVFWMSERSHGGVPDPFTCRISSYVYLGRAIKRSVSTLGCLASLSGKYTGL